MKKIMKSALVAGLALSIGGTGLVATSTSAHAYAVSATNNAEQINALIQEKQELIMKKKTSRNGQEQKALGIRIGEIEREIQALKSGQVVTGGSTSTANTGNASTATPTSDVAAQITALIQEKQELVLKKKTSRDSQEQKALGIRIGEIEREIQALKSGQAVAGGNTSTANTGNASTSTPSVSDVTAQVNELIKQKQELVNKKKVSRNKQEQKDLGKQISAIEKQIKQLKKNK